MLQSMGSQESDTNEQLTHTHTHTHTHKAGGVAHPATSVTGLPRRRHCLSWERCVPEHEPAKRRRCSGFKASTVLWKYTSTANLNSPGHVQTSTYTVHFKFVKWCGGRIKHGMYFCKQILICS